MEDRQQLYTVGIWTAKEGKEDEFAREWAAFARWTSEHQPGAADAYLLQDAAHSQRFISFGPWESAERIDAWRATPEFKAFGDRAGELCDEFQPGTYIVAAHV